KVNALTGALTLVSASPFAVGNEPRNIIIDPSGRFVYIADRGAGSIYGFSINLTTGNLTALSRSPFSIGPTSSPWSVAIDPSGRFLCMIDLGTNTVNSFSIDPTSGNLTFVSGKPTGMEAEGVGVDPSGRFVYVAASGMYAYTISSTGVL